GVGDLGRVGADVVVVVGARQRVYAVGAQRDGGGRLRGRAAQRPLQRDEAALHQRLVARADVVTRQPRVGAHRPPIGGGDVPVAFHLGEDEARQPVLL